MTKEILTKTILAWGGGLWKIKFDLTREYPVATMEFHQGILAWGGSLWKIKFDFTRECPVVTMEQRVKHMVTMGVLLDKELNTGTPWESFWTKS